MSFIRLLISIALIFLFQHQGLFITGYFLCGISDVADGYLARRCKLETRIGERLDSLGDTAFCGAVLYLLVAHTDTIETPWAMTGIAIVTVLRVINFIITKVKFKTWAAMHTWGNKATGILLFLYAPAVLIFNTILLIPGLALCFIAAASSIEEMAILLTSKQYDANCKSIFIR
ncbi:MAG: CDP-alcohol phosphatidyltransferase family protein [Lacrimispora sp.]